MNSKIKLFCLSLLTSTLMISSASYGQTQSSDFYLIADTSSDVFYINIKQGGFKLEGDKLLLGILVKSFDKKDKQSSFTKKYIKVDDCIEGYGQMYHRSLSDDFLYKTDWVQGGGTVASGIADYLCGVIKDQASKSKK